MVGGPNNNSNMGAVWVFTRSGGSWSQQGAPFFGNATAGAQLGSSVAVSGDGNTAIVGAPYEFSSAGRTYVFTRSGGVWSQQGGRLVGSDGSSAAKQGISVALSADGNTLALGGNADNGFAGAAWVFTRSGTSWTQQGAKLVGTVAVSNAQQGYSVALAGNASTAALGGTTDNSNVGAVWVFVQPALAVGPTANIAASGNVGGPFVAPSFDYALIANGSAVDYAISGVPDWLTPSSTSGAIAAGGQATITFTANGTAATKSAGSYGPSVITFANSTNGVGGGAINAT